MSVDSCDSCNFVHGLGSGVFATRSFSSREFLLEYRGEYLDEEGEKRQTSGTDASYVYFFQHQRKRMW